MQETAMCPPHYKLSTQPDYSKAKQIYGTDCRDNFEKYFPETFSLIIRLTLCLPKATSVISDDGAQLTTAALVTRRKGCNLGLDLAVLVNCRWLI